MSREVVCPEPGADEPRTVMHCGDPYEDDLEPEAGKNGLAPPGRFRVQPFLHTVPGGATKPTLTTRTQLNDE